MKATATVVPPEPPTPSITLTLDGEAVDALTNLCGHVTSEPHRWGYKSRSFAETTLHALRNPR